MAWKTRFLKLFIFFSSDWSNSAECWLFYCWRRQTAISYRYCEKPWPTADSSFSQTITNEFAFLCTSNIYSFVLFHSNWCGHTAFEHSIFILVKILIKYVSMNWDLWSGFWSRSTVLKFCSCVYPYSLAFPSILWWFR